MFEVIHKPFDIEILKMPYKLSKTEHIFFFFFPQVIKLANLSFIYVNHLENSFYYERNYFLTIRILASKSSKAYCHSYMHQ